MPGGPVLAAKREGRDDGHDEEDEDDDARDLDPARRARILVRVCRHAPASATTPQEPAGRTASPAQGRKEASRSTSGAPSPSSSGATATHAHASVVTSPVSSSASLASTTTTVRFPGAP